MLRFLFFAAIASTFSCETHGMFPKAFKIFQSTVQLRRFFKSQEEKCTGPKALENYHFILNRLAYPHLQYNNNYRILYDEVNDFQIDPVHMQIMGDKIGEKNPDRPTVNNVIVNQLQSRV